MPTLKRKQTADFFLNCKGKTMIVNFYSIATIKKADSYLLFWVDTKRKEFPRLRIYTIDIFQKQGQLVC